jgi:hypothetical protein
MTIARDKRFIRVGSDRPGGSERDRGRLIDTFGEFLARQIEPERRYSLIRIADGEFAYTHYTQYTRALRDVWAAGLVPEALPAAVGGALPRAAPRLRGVDSDVAEFLSR